eukprot:5238334-Amphidinium_carterae.1
MMSASVNGIHAGMMMARSTTVWTARSNARWGQACHSNPKVIASCLQVLRSKLDYPVFYNVSNLHQCRALRGVPHLWSRRNC